MQKRDLLYGHDDEERVVGLHAEGDTKIRLYKRNEHGSVSSRTVEFYPFGHFTEKGADTLSEGYSPRSVDVLSGPGGKDRIVQFSTQKQFWSARQWLKGQVEGHHYDINPSLTSQYLQWSGKTLFQGMTMEDIVRMQIDLEVQAPAGKFPNAERVEDEIIIVSISTNRGQRWVLHQRPETGSLVDGEEYRKNYYREVASEKQLIRDLVKIVHRYDPDVLEFHNGLGFDLPYLRDRANLLGVNLALGRDNKKPKTFSAKKQFAEREQEYTNFICGGRSVIDSYFLAADFDVFARDLPGYGLKELASYFGFAADDRTYVEGSQITDVWQSNPMRLIRYALDDAIETRKLVDKLGTSTYELTKILPATYQDVMTLGTAGSIEILMKRAYIREGESIPTPEAPDPPKGGYTEVFRRGVYKDLAYADVSSLYPNNMILYGVDPDSDSLGVFRPLLKLLTDLRLKAKEKMKEMDEGPKRDTIDAKQQAFKVLINSFYGALGFAFFPWNDYDDAALTTRKGRLNLKRLIHEIKDRGGTPVLCDSVTPDTPVYIRRNNTFDIVSIKQVHEWGSDLDGRRREPPKDIEVFTGSGWRSLNYTYKHETDKEIVQTDIGPGSIRTTKDHSLFSGSKKVSPDDLTEGDPIDTNSPSLPNKDSSSSYKKGYLYGLLAGDGSASKDAVYESGRQRYQVVLHNSDPTILRRAENIIRDLYGMDMNLYNTMSSSGTDRLSKESRDLWEQIGTKMYDDATRQKKVPKFVLNGDENVKKGFLAGYTDADGSIDPYNNWGASTKSHVLAAGVKMIAEEFDRNISVRSRPDKPSVVGLKEVNNVSTSVTKQIERGPSDSAVYDLSTEDGTFVAGVGCFVAKNTDGVMFELPRPGMTDEEVDRFIGETISGAMPPGIEIDNDGRFRRVVSYKRKNYAKIPKGGDLDDISLAGNSLIGRGVERFLREYIEHQMQALAAENLRRMAEIHDAVKGAIMNRELSPDQIKKRGRLKMTMDEYADSPSNLARYEVAKTWEKRTGKEAKAGDTFWYYVAGDEENPTVFQAAKLIEDYNEDENRHYLLQRLDDTADIFRSMVTEPEKVYSMDVSPPGQGRLFGNTHDLDGVKIVAERVRELPPNPSDEKIKPIYEPS